MEGDGGGEGKAERNSHAVTWAVFTHKRKVLSVSFQLSNDSQQPSEDAQELRTAPPPAGQAGPTQRNASADPAPLPQPRCSSACCCSAPPWRSAVQVSEYLGARHLGLRGSVHPGRVSALTSPGSSRYSEYPRKAEAVCMNL